MLVLPVACADAGRQRAKGHVVLVLDQVLHFEPRQTVFLVLGILARHETRIVREEEEGNPARLDGMAEAHERLHRKDELAQPPGAPEDERDCAAEREHGTGNREQKPVSVRQRERDHHEPSFRALRRADREFPPRQRFHDHVRQPFHEIAPTVVGGRALPILRHQDGRRAELAGVRGDEVILCATRTIHY